MQKFVHLVDLVTSFPTNIFLQNLASTQKRTNPVKFAHFAEKSGKGSISNLSTKVTGSGLQPTDRVSVHLGQVSCAASRKSAQLEAIADCAVDHVDQAQRFTLHALSYRHALEESFTVCWKRWDDDRGNARGETTNEPDFSAVVKVADLYIAGPNTYYTRYPTTIPEGVVSGLRAQRARRRAYALRRRSFAAVPAPTPTPTPTPQPASGADACIVGKPCTLTLDGSPWGADTS